MAPSRWSSDHDAPPSPPGIPRDPAAATGPPWPSLIARSDVHSPPRMARWPVVAGIVPATGNPPKTQSSTLGRSGADLRRGVRLFRLHWRGVREHSRQLRS